MATNKYSAEEVIEAIKNSGGIKMKIAQKLGCHRHTVDRYIEDYVTVRQAYENECEQPLDVSESIVLGNIYILAEIQQKTKQVVDSSDAKWYLTKKGKSRGYVERQEVRNINLDVSELSDDELERIAGGEDPFAVVGSKGQS